jgi:hypothetical protein
VLVLAAVRRTGHEAAIGTDGVVRITITGARVVRWADDALTVAAVRSTLSLLAAADNLDAEVSLAGLAVIEKRAVAERDGIGAAVVAIVTAAARHAALRKIRVSRAIEPVAARLSRLTVVVDADGGWSVCRGGGSGFWSARMVARYTLGSSWGCGSWGYDRLTDGLVAADALADSGLLVAWRARDGWAVLLRDAVASAMLAAGHVLALALAHLLVLAIDLVMLGVTE